MEGAVFLDFIALARDRCDAASVESALEQPGLASGGTYLASRRYEERELIALAVALGVESNLTPNQLLREFGARLFERCAGDFGAMLDNLGGTAALLGAIDQYVTSSGAVLRPYADLLQVHGLRLDTGQLLLQSLMRTPLLEVATGFFAAATDYFSEELTVVSALESDDAEFPADDALQIG